MELVGYIIPKQIKIQDNTEKYQFAVRYFDFTL